MAANTYALKLDLVDTDRVDLSTSFDIKNMSQFTFEAWVKPGAAATVSNQRAFSIRQGTAKRQMRFGLVAIEGKLRFELARLDGTSDTNYTYAYDWDDYWHHVAFTADFNAKTYNMYIDGGLVQSGRIPDGGTSLAVSNVTASAVTVGAWSPTTTEADFIYWDGKIDNIRLWSTVRTITEIADNMNDHVLTSATGLIDEWRFNTGSGFTVTSSKNAYTGTCRRANGTVQTSLQWDSDRPFMGDGLVDVDTPSDNTMTAPTSITSDGFTLNWTASTDDVYVQYYEITVATDSAFASAVTAYAALNVGLVTTLDVTGLSPSTNYYARVRAFDAAGNASAYVTYNSNAAITTIASSDLTPPSASVASSATALSDTGFTANWGAATDNVAVTGYKLDVATDENFTSFVSGFSNLDVGNVLTYAVTGTIDPSTTYYYRVRAYDAGENESADSNTVTVTTSAPPDTEAPSIVVTQVATSVGSRSFTARWNIGVDNVGVTGYKLDVATDEAFTTFVDGYQDLDVGNVTSYGLTFLEPQTGYLYRVRAYDAAGNISADTDDPEAVTTRASTVDEGGMLEVVHFPLSDTYVRETSAATNYNTAASLTVDGTPDGHRVYMYFDLREVTGTIVNANLRLFLSNASAGTFSIQLVNETVDFSTISWATDTLTFSGTPVDFLPSATGWVEVDIASLLNGADEYTIVIKTTSTDAIVFSSLEAATDQPHLVVETDPTSSTEVDTVTLSAENANQTNLLINPSAEVGGTAFGGATGITAINTSTLLQDSTYAHDGTYSCKVVTTTTAGDGVKFESATALAIPGTGQTFTGLLHITSPASYQTFSANLRLTYTDASVTNGGTVTIDCYSGWRWFEMSAIATNGKTVDKVEIIITDGTTTARTFWIDSCAVVETSDSLVYFDGDTTVDADWNGTANASSSTYEFVQLPLSVTYIGDGDQDNSVALRYKRAEASDWIQPSTLAASINRSTKEITATIGPSYIGNYISNPNFDVGSNDWSLADGGTVISVLPDEPRFNDTDGNVLLVTTTTAAVGMGVVSSGGTMLSAIGETWTFSVYLKGGVGGEQVQIGLDEYSTAFTSVAAHESSTIVLTTEWQRYTLTVTTTSASVNQVRAKIITPSALAQDVYVSGVQVEKGAVANPYIDGYQSDGVWAGVASLSETYRVLSHEVSYDVEITITDPDGVIGTNPASGSVTTEAAPDDPLSVVSLTLTASNDEIAAVASYTGDDNLSASALVQYRRSDLSTWSTVAHTWDRTNHQVLATIANLKPGTDYDVKVTFTDTDDGVYGANPIQTSATTTITGLTAATKEKISFGGFMLSGDDDNGFLITEHDSLSHPERLTQVEQLARADGAVELSDWWGKRKIKLKGVVVGETRTMLYARIAELRKALAPRQQRLVIDTLAANNYYFNATCTSLGISEVGGESIRHVLFDAEFTCADPFRYEASETVESNIELFDDEEVVITNDGDLAIDPIFTFTTTSATGVSLTLVNETTGERITPDGTIASGDRLVIDTSKLSVLKNGVEIDYAGGFPRLAVGQNTITVVLSSGSVSLTVRRRHRFL